MRVLITGANGFVGSHLARRCLESGDVVRCLVRREGVPQSLAGMPVELVVGDVTDAASLERAVAGVDIVYHLAARLSARTRDEMFRTNVAGTRNLVDAAVRAATVRRFVFCSSIAAAGPSAPGRPRVEDDDGAPVSAYGASKALAERVVRARAAGRLDVTIVRPPIVYGPRDRGLLPVFASVGRGLRLLVGASRTYSWVYGPDLADAIATIGRHGACAGATLYAAHPEVATTREVVDLIARAAGRGGLALAVPDSAVRAVASVLDLLSQATGASGLLTRDKVSEVVQPSWVCSPAAAGTVAGWRARTPLAEGIPATVRWYQEHGWMAGRGPTAGA